MRPCCQTDPSKVDILSVDNLHTLKVPGFKRRCETTDLAILDSNVKATTVRFRWSMLKLTRCRLQWRRGRW